MTFIGPGTVTTGGVESRRLTFTWKLAEPWFPALSVAVQFTVVWPIANVAPEAGAQFGVSVPSTLSDALAEYETVVPPGLPVDVLMSEGTVTTGLV